MNLNEIVNPVLLGLAISTSGVATEASQKVYRTSHSCEQGFEELSIPSANCFAISTNFASDEALTTEAGNSSIQKETVSEAIASIRARLSLQVKELAQIFGVGRPTIYSWINEESSPHGHRLERIESVAKAVANLHTDELLTAAQHRGCLPFSLRTTGKIGQKPCV